VYKLAEEMRVPLRKAVGCEWIAQVSLELSGVSYNKEKFVVGGAADFSQHNNSLYERAMGGGWKEKESSREKNRVCGGIEGGMVGFVLSLGSSFSLDRRRTSFDFCVEFSIGPEGIEKDRGDCDDLVELWEEGLIDF